MQTVTSQNPATGEILSQYPSATNDDLALAFVQARAAQKHWAMIPVRTRAKMLLDLREVLIERAPTIASTLSLENGKPEFEAFTCEIVPCVDLLTFYAKSAPKVLKDKKIPMRLLKHRSSSLNYWPLGVVAVISPWNYPFFLPFGEIVMAVVSGNSVLFKPSEITSTAGKLIRDLFEEAGFPKNLVQILYGDGKVGAEIISQKPDKIFFTGSVPTGKKIMAQAAHDLIPVNLELGGKDPMIVFKDADLDFATSAALWGGYANAGQVCASVERLIIEEDVAEKFKALLVEKIRQLRQGPSISGKNELGPITLEKQKHVYKSQLKDAQDRGCEVLVGGGFSEDDRFLEPTLISGKNIEQSTVYTEETFGPVIALTTFKTINEAIEKANHSNYGLLASIFTQNMALADRVARQIQAGTVIINEVLYTAGLPETPWGGVKDSGIGRTHADFGLFEFVNVRHIHRPKLTPFQWKSPWWFPYTPYQFEVFKNFLELYRKSFWKKLAALPLLIWNFVQMIKKEPRL